MQFIVRWCFRLCDNSNEDALRDAMSSPSQVSFASACLFGCLRYVCPLCMYSWAPLTGAYRKTKHPRACRISRSVQMGGAMMARRLSRAPMHHVVTLLLTRRFVCSWRCLFWFCKCLPVTCAARTCIGMKQGLAREKPICRT